MCWVVEGPLIILRYFDVTVHTREDQLSQQPNVLLVFCILALRPWTLVERFTRIWEESDRSIHNVEPRSKVMILFIHDISRKGDRVSTFVRNSTVVCVRMCQRFQAQQMKWHGGSNRTAKSIDYRLNHIWPTTAWSPFHESSGKQPDLRLSYKSTNLKRWLYHLATNAAFLT